MKRFFVLVICVLVVSGGFLCMRWYADNRRPNFDGTARIYVYPSTTPEDVVEQIQGQCNILDLKSLLRTFEAKKVADYITPGFYVIGPSNCSAYVARMLNNGWQSPVRLTLSGNLRIRGNIASKIASQMMVDSASVKNAMDNPEFLCSLDCSPETVFSIFMPDTYEMYWSASAEEILSRLKQATDDFWTEERLSKASSLGLSRLQATTLASIVDAESNYAPEMPLIAGVYLNRLRIGMPLQADPTVAFCFDYKPERILKKHLEVDSPYNTYKHAGLPPAPICVPTREAIDAVLAPDYGPGNLYFCANPDFSGKHVFAKTLSQHNANARAFQAELSRRAREKRMASR
ncbi:MAG: endolytic transglycosylase MltG [Bacteroidales bacterium]|nr:endolytic transglycosylase MltG [Bacteroidales bacterium]